MTSYLRYSGFFRIFIFTTAGVKRVAAVKSCPDIISYCYTSSGPSGSTTPIHLVLRTEYRSSRYLSWTDSIKTESAIFILYFGLVALEGSTFYQIVFHYLGTPFKILFYLVPSILFSFRTQTFFQWGDGILRFLWYGTQVSYWRFFDKHRMNTFADVLKLRIHNNYV